nr:cupin domain-containing protein [Lachnospiraceae bacterium]
RRDTWPAVALACSYLRDVRKVSPDEPVIVCPVDPYVDDEYFRNFNRLFKMVREDRWKLNLMGVRPTYPSEKYGYLVPEDSGSGISEVVEYTEKPDLQTAEKLLDRGALWNCGVFAFRLGYMLEKAKELLPYSDHRSLSENYQSVEKISFDYAVGEKEKSAGVLVYDKGWKDIGSWNTFAEEMHGNIIGKGEMDSTCENTNIVNELGIPVIAMGLKSVIVAASNDGILVADKHQSSYMKPLVEKLDEKVRYAEKSWGSFTIIDSDEKELTIRVVLLPGHRLHYHSHERRDEVWTVTEGRGFATVDGERIDVEPGSVIKLPAGSKHMVTALTPLKIIEVQIGEEIDVGDKIKYDYPD